MAIIRALCSLPYVSGVPEDVTVSRFHFATGASVSGADLDEIGDRLALAYAPVGPFLSPRIDRSACTVRMYDLDDPEPRVPLRDEPLVVASTAQTSSMPQEVALVLSFRGAYTSGVPKARRRNRTYFGPLTVSSSLAASGQPSRPVAGVIDALQTFAFRMAEPVSVSTVKWVGVSETGGTTNFPIVESWVDNEWDTQRRRGVRATLRDTQAILQ